MKAKLSPEISQMLIASTTGTADAFDKLPLSYMAEYLSFPEGTGFAALQLLAEKAERGEDLNPLEALGANLLQKMAAFGDWSASPPPPEYLETLHTSTLTGTYSTDIPPEVFVKGLSLEMTAAMSDQLEQHFGSITPDGFRIMCAEPLTAAAAGDLQQLRIQFEVKFRLKRRSGVPLVDVLSLVGARVRHHSQPLPLTMRKLDNFTTQSL